MKNQKTISSYDYDLKRVDKVSLIITWVLVALIIGQAFLQDVASGPLNAIKALPVGILVTVVYFLKINRFAKSLLFGLIPALAVCAAMMLDVFSLDKHYMVFAATALIALYFNRKLLIVYGSVVNAALIAMYILSPAQLLGEPSTIPVFLSIFILFNGQIVILFFLTKWGSGILNSAAKNNAEVKELLRKLQLSSQSEKKQAEYQQACVSKLLDNLKCIADGVLDCDLTLDDCDADTSELYDLHASINDSLKKSIEAIKQMAFDISVLSSAAQQGQLGQRVEVEHYLGEYKRIVTGMNDALNAIQKPIDDVSAIMAQISAGSLDGSISTEYQGDYAALIADVNDTTAGLKEIITEISSALTSMANGDLDVSLSADYKGDFLKIKKSLNYIIDSFNSVLNDIGSTSRQVAMGTKQFSSGAQVLSQGASEQASAIEELTSSITEIADQTRQNAVHASEANDLAVSVNAAAVRGNAHMQEMLRSMSSISDSSRDISRIIKVIDDIAFQTNILALNAAVEAARAGVHGKGFAVVAEEVRNLASKSAEAARETAALIEGSMKGVEGGLKIAQSTAGAFQDIIAGAEKTAVLVAGIAVSSDQQAIGIAQVSKGVEQVAAVVQSNSAMAQQSASTSEQLSSQADFLEEMSNRFELKKELCRQ